MKVDEAILRFFRDDIGGILITDAAGNVIYTDEQTDFIREDPGTWKKACPPAREGQKREIWDLIHGSDGKSYMVTTSTFTDEKGMKQIHHLADSSMYIGLFKDITDYSRTLRTEKDHDVLTGLYSRKKFTEMKQQVFEKQETIAVFNMDINNLKQMNDQYGHSAGDRLIRKAAESLKRIEARNIIPFRIGGDEFVVVAIHVSRETAEEIRQKWQEGLEELNRQDDGVKCEIACGFAFGEGAKLEEVFGEADERMYAEKKRMKGEKR